ncbi:MAG TPA: hypothetical protein DEE98_09070 [Elusimicrobia bacterium]|nr:MAG: hypothetical protein A2278_06565 [Elusimicrobia bacterium RIFOXYA12_FULL_49_49]OGS10614.1 MAG: hypothetical protein A2386_00805 [Elusimicrobia bacterium RIFOXYB1_FULL_48_9]OGS16288.1 MAG: hypothetical protein A2251_01620 [Elusimicrobia bacterium RIFOXYA2_FULL_47_53]OGS25961.1 MAG: hypothetical protein A2339_01900 [Elusimicrobia bacterium RIFOXYB12_FULL_50_12]OGS31443.1 MAG: hypothetical protein A2323_09910 [Elusimicrobia bacterium RIFOXYB2_FULL_46_23]HBU70514.1 hypothetical protein [El
MGLIMAVASADGVQKSIFDSFLNNSRRGARNAGETGGFLGVAGYLGALAVRFCEALVEFGAYELPLAKALSSGSKVLIAKFGEAPAPIVNREYIFAHSGDLGYFSKIGANGGNGPCGGSDKFLNYITMALEQKSLRNYRESILSLCGRVESQCPGSPLTFVLSNKDHLIGYCDKTGNKLYYSYSFGSFVFCSERLSGTDWIEMEKGELIIVNKNGSFLEECQLNNI